MVRVAWPADTPDLGVPVEDWQELVATWTESAFLASDKGRERRLRYLYRVHAAVRDDDFSRIHTPDDRLDLVPPQHMGNVAAVAVDLLESRARS